LGVILVFNELCRAVICIRHGSPSLMLPRAYAKGGLGLNPPLEFAMLQKRHYLCKGVCVCFRTFFACLMSA